MADADLEEQKKSVLPFMQRAQEMQTSDPKIAYYCRMYGVEQALKFEKRAKEIHGLVVAALAQMEKEKPKLGLDKENDRFYCEDLALKVFNNADKVDRAGRADLGTAKAFLAASYFLEVLNHFGPVEGDLLEKQRYAAWRAAEIRRAVREGRPALPPAGATGAASAAPLGDELPAAYGSAGSSFTAGGAGSTASVDDLPAAGSSSFYGDSAAKPYSAPSLPVPPPLPAHEHQAPPGAAPPPPPPPQQAVPPQQPPRFRPGSRLLYLAEGAAHPEPVTVGQVLPAGGPDGQHLYRVAFRDRLEDVPDGDGRLAPCLAEGDAVLFLGRGLAPTPARVVLVNDMAWPSSFLLRLDAGGSEVAASAEQVSLALDAPAAGAPERQQDQQQHSLSAPPPLHSYSQPPAAQHQSAPPSTAQQPYYPPRGGYAGATAALPPQQPQQQPHSHYAQPAAATQQAPAVQLPPGHKPSVQAIMDAQKNAKYAVSSLNFEDVPSAVKYLQTALRILTTPS